MIVPLRTSTPDAVDYPDDDGNPMAENTLQFQWIVTLQGGLDDLFRSNPDVFVAGDLLWYAVEGDNTRRAAPDAMVVFGRPKGYRGSYQQWNENGVAPQVVFEVLSPGNRAGEMARKWQFYEAHGVEEYYIYDPDDVELSGFTRNPSGHFDPVAEMNGFVSPRLGIQFDMNGAELVIRRRDGSQFLTYLELSERAAQESNRAARESKRATRESQRADSESQRATDEAMRAERQAQRAAEESLRAEKAEQELLLLRAKLKAAGIAVE